MTEKKIEFQNNDYDIKIKEKEYRASNGINSHYLTLEFEGDDLNNKIMNMMRRACSNNVPVYAYAKELINIIENTSIAFNNDYMKLDLSLLPIFGIDPEIYDLDEEYWYNVNYADKDRKKHTSEKSIEFYLAYHNNSADIVDVTTNHAQVYIDGKQIEMYNKEYPTLIIQLRGNESFKCHMKGVLGVAERRDDGALWKACKRVGYDEIEGNGNKKKYELQFFGNEQFSEYEMLIRTCKFLINKLGKIKKMISDKVKKGEITEEKTIEITLENEDFTIGEPINYEIQDHKKIVFSGFRKPDHLIKTGSITVSCVDTEKSPINGILESIDILSEKVNKIGYLLTNMNDKNMPKEKKEEKKDLNEKKKKK
jgi:DNA-directed RNA polymerase subunit L